MTEAKGKAALIFKFVYLVLKVSPFRKEFLVFSILPKNERKMSAPGQKFEFSSSLMGKIEDTKKAFRNYLTFT